MGIIEKEPIDMNGSIPLAPFEKENSIDDAISLLKHRDARTAPARRGCWILMPNFSDESKSIFEGDKRN